MTYIVHFWDGDKHVSFLHIDTMNFEQKASLQCLYNISKKKLTIKLFNKTMRNKKFLCVVKYLSQLLLCSFVMQNFQIFYGSSHV